MKDIDFGSIKQRFDLAHMIEVETGQPARYGKHVHCPFHSDTTPSMMIYPDGRWHCFSCGKHGDLFDFLGKLWDCDLRGVIDRLNEPGFAATIRHIPHQAKPLTTLRPTLDQALVEQLEDKLGDRETAYWRRQGISPSVLYGLRIGWTGKRYAFPWFYRGILTAFKLRRDDDLSPGMEPKYISAKGSRFTAPYNIDAVLDGMPSRVLIVEDEKSVMAALRYGITAIATPANSWKKEWSDLLADVPDVIVIADNDDPGMTSAQKIARMIPRAIITSAPNTHKDLFDFHLHLHECIGDKMVEQLAIQEWLGI